MNTPRIQKSTLVYIGYIPFFGRIIRSIIIHYFRHTRLAYIVVKRMGALFLVDQHNKVDRSFLVKGEWEPQQISRLMQLINLHRPKNAPSIFLDIGAHGGLYSIILGKTEEFQQLFSFDPTESIWHSSMPIYSSMAWPIRFPSSKPQPPIAAERPASFPAGAAIRPVSFASRSRGRRGYDRRSRKNRRYDQAKRRFYRRKNRRGRL